MCQTVQLVPPALSQCFYVTLVSIRQEDSVVRYDWKIWTHAAQRCCGLPPEAFKAVIEFEEFRLIYLCTPCHLNKDNSSNNSFQAGINFLILTKL